MVITSIPKTIKAPAEYQELLVQTCIHNQKDLDQLVKKFIAVILPLLAVLAQAVPFGQKFKVIPSYYVPSEDVNKIKSGFDILSKAFIDAGIDPRQYYCRESWKAEVSGRVRSNDVLYKEVARFTDIVKQYKFPDRYFFCYGFMDSLIE